MDRSDKYTTGIIVGRFQVDELTEGHVDLISRVVADHKRTVVVLGLSPCKCTYNNPLDFQARKSMINERFPDVEVLYIYDVGSDVLWSDTLDGMLIKANCNKETTCLYGSRDSFIQYYCGNFDTQVLEQEVFTSGTAKRKELAKYSNKNKDFRAGVIWATMNQYPSCYPTVDMAFFNETKSRILLARKPNEKAYRFVGGFVQPGQTFEETAVRETLEETHLTAHEVEYQKSFVINDWRYKNEQNKITTSLFVVTKWEGTPEPDDDIEELRWFPFNKHTLGSIVPEHVEMFDYLLKKEGK